MSCPGLAPLGGSIPVPLPPCPAPNQQSGLHGQFPAMLLPLNTMPAIFLSLQKNFHPPLPKPKAGQLISCHPPLLSNRRVIFGSKPTQIFKRAVAKWKRTSGIFHAPSGDPSLSAGKLNLIPSAQSSNQETLRECAHLVDQIALGPKTRIVERSRNISKRLPTATPIGRKRILREQSGRIPKGPRMIGRTAARHVS